MYDELKERCRACSQGCNYPSECSYFDKPPLRCMRQLLSEAADAIEELIRKIESLESMREITPEAEYAIDKHADNIISHMEELIRGLENKPRWIPVSESLPETGVDVLVKFPQNMAVASIDIGEWVVNSGDGWCTDINLAGGEKNPTHWMPLPQPPEEKSL